MRFGITYSRKRPAHLRRNGRAIDPHFLPGEKLFRRIKQEHFVDGNFSPLSISFDNPPSLNRSKYSHPTDVLFSEQDEFLGWGVISFPVHQIPRAYPQHSPMYTFTPTHAPLENNYSHSEIFCDRIPATGAYTEPQQGIRKLMRAELSQIAQIEIRAKV
jgi:hypothetical protein